MSVLTDIKAKSHPAMIFVYNATGGEWEAMTTNVNTIGAVGMDFKGALLPQKSTATYLFLYDNSLAEWRAATASDLGGGSANGIVSLTTGVTSHSLTGLSLTGVPSYVGFNVIKPNQAAPFVGCSPRYDSLTASGAVVEFEVAIPDTGYYLSYSLK